MAITHPPSLINKYLEDRLSGILNITAPFFPTGPSTIDQLTQTATVSNNAGLFAVYDRMFKMRRKPFPHIKSEQLLYYFYSLNIEAMLDATQVIYDLLDRGDESAEDINEWVRLRLVNGLFQIKDPSGNVIKEIIPVYFHDFRIFQLEESRDIVDFGTARTFSGNKIIIDYNYHTVGYPHTLENGEYVPGDENTYNQTNITS